MKTHKIQNVEKSVCTVEQKLAYNIAFRCHINYGNEFRSCPTEISRVELITHMRNFYMEEMRRNSKIKYNPDALFVALNHGLRNYMENPFIATDYATIGKSFPIPYGIE